MARKRMIDPSLWSDDGFAGLSATQQLLYIGLFSNADDDGRLKGSATAVRLMLPAVYGGWDLEDIEADLVSVLAQMTQLRRYVVDGKPYLVFLNYQTWQKIEKPYPSLLPAPSADWDAAAGSTGDDTATIPQPFPDHSPNDPQPVAEQSENAPQPFPARREEKRSKEKRREHEETVATATAPPIAIAAKRSRAPTQPSETWSLIEDYCERSGIDASELGSREKGKQGAAAKRLLEQYPRDDVLACLDWLLSDTWQRERGVDLLTVESRMLRFIAAGRPAPRANGGRASPNGGDDEPEPQYYREFTGFGPPLPGSVLHRNYDEHGRLREHPL